MECATPWSESGALALQQGSTSEGEQFDIIDLDLVGAAICQLSHGAAVSLRALRLLLEQWVGANLESHKKIIRRLAVQAVERAVEVTRLASPNATATAQKFAAEVWEPLPCASGPYARGRELFAELHDMTDSCRQVPVSALVDQSYVQGGWYRCECSQCGRHCASSGQSFGTSGIQMLASVDLYETLACNSGTGEQTPGWSPLLLSGNSLVMKESCSHVEVASWPLALMATMGSFFMMDCPALLGGKVGPLSPSILEGYYQVIGCLPGCSDSQHVGPRWRRAMSGG